MMFQTEDGLLNPQIPFHRRLRILGVLLAVQAFEIALCVGSDLNAICHVWLQTRQKTPSLAVFFLPSHPQDPGEWLPRRLHAPQYRVAADTIRHPALPLPPSLSP